MKDSLHSERPRYSMPQVASLAMLVWVAICLQPAKARAEPAQAYCGASFDSFIFAGPVSYVPECLIGPETGRFPEVWRAALQQEKRVTTVFIEQDPIAFGLRKIYNFKEEKTFKPLFSGLARVAISKSALTADGMVDAQNLGDFEVPAGPIYDASEGTKIDPLRLKNWDLNSSKRVPDPKFSPMRGQQQ